MIGQTISHYRIVDKLGGGGMGVVYKAEDTQLGRFVALKFLPDELSHDPQALERFRREARAASALNHPNICTIYEIGQHEAPILHRDGVSGRHDAEAPHRLPSPRTPTASQSGHRNRGRARSGSLQRILSIATSSPPMFSSPSVTTPRFSISDWPKSASNAARFWNRRRSPPQHRSGTRAPDLAGRGLGTVAYMSPEQALAEELDARTDIFSFGVVLYEMCTGRLPFEGGTSAAIFNAILNKVPTSPVRLNPDLPAELERIVNKALEKDRDLRYQSAADIRADLKRLQRDWHPSSQGQSSLGQASLGQSLSGQSSQAGPGQQLAAPASGSIRRDPVSRD